MLYTITGPSGSGKSTLVRMLLEGYPERFRKVVTSTTRKPRRGEQDGIDYHFEPLPEGGFDAWKSYHTASAEFDGNFYGIGTADYDGLFGGNTDSIVILEPSGAREMKSLFPDDVRTVYVRIGAARAARHMKKRHSRYKKRQKADIGAGLFDENGYDYVTTKIFTASSVAFSTFCLTYRLPLFQKALTVSCSTSVPLGAGSSANLSAL